MTITDSDIEKEIVDAKEVLRRGKLGNAPQGMILRSEFNLAVYEELKLWRENGRKWLKFMNEPQPTVMVPTVFESLQPKPAPLAQEYENHVPMRSKLNSDNEVYYVECSCGEVTKYRVPISNLKEFECPKQKRSQNAS